MSPACQPHDSGRCSSAGPSVPSPAYLPWLGLLVMGLPSAPVAAATPPPPRRTSRPDRQAGRRDLRPGRTVQPGQYPPPEGARARSRTPRTGRQGPRPISWPCRRSPLPRRRRSTGPAPPSLVGRLPLVEEPRRLQQEDGVGLPGERLAVGHHDLAPDCGSAGEGGAGGPDPPAVPRRSRSTTPGEAAATP